MSEQQKPNETDVYAIHGADPEVLAYAMAKYSRSALTMKESLAEISSQRAEQFLNTFYFQYGHRSIADLAHIPFAIERLSLLAAIAVVDEQRWDGQERSTRYQNFRRSGWYTPDLGQLVQIARRKRHRGSSLRQLQSAGASDALRRPGYQCNTTSQTAHSPPQLNEPELYEATHPQPHTVS